MIVQLFDGAKAIDAQTCVLEDFNSAYIIFDESWKRKQATTRIRIEMKNEIALLGKLGLVYFIVKGKKVEEK